jgi:ABC-type uncharacterized transport system involved in gliding motility auxiliary subunit
MNHTIRRIVPWLPWAGLILLATGAVLTVITRRFEPGNNALLGAGALLLLFYAASQPDAVRAVFQSRYARFGSSTLLSILFFTAIALFLYWLAYQNDDWRVDMTSDALFTAPPETVELLEAMDEPVHVVGFYSLSLAGQQDQARVILDNLAAVSENLTYEFVDPEVNPLLAQQYEINFDGTLVFVRNRGEAEETFSRANTLSEQDIHTALLKIVNPVAKKLYVLAGHGEAAVDDFGADGLGSAVGLLEDQGFEVESLNLFTAGEVPADATVVAVVGPRGPLEEAESEALASFLDAGGSAFVARDLIDLQGTLLGGDDALDAYLAESWGIMLREDIVIDPEMARAGQTSGLDFLGASYGSSPIITADVRSFGSRFSVARSISTTTGSGVVHTPLVQTSASAWGETDLDLLIETFAAEPDAQDVQGVLDIGVAAEDPNNSSRLVVFGDADFANNANLLTGGNNLLFVNSLNWLADDETTIELAPRPMIERQVNIPEQQLRLLRMVSTWFGPVLMGLIGLFVWTRRRSNL